MLAGPHGKTLSPIILNVLYFEFSWGPRPEKSCDDSGASSSSRDVTRLYNIFEDKKKALPKPGPF